VESRDEKEKVGMKKKKCRNDKSGRMTKERVPGDMHGVLM
jgi:hypothetical protein